MLPACRTTGDEFAIPTFELTPRDVAGFTDELQEFQGSFHDCFLGVSHAPISLIMVGQLSPLERKSIEPMALRVPGGSAVDCSGFSVRSPGMRSICGGPIISSSPRRWVSPMGS